MGGFRSWLANFMQGRYGYDALGRSMSIWVIILIAASIVITGYIREIMWRMIG